MINIADTSSTETSIDLQSPDIRANPYPTYAMMREQHPVCQVEPDGIWAISRYDDVRFALKRHDLFSSSGFKAVLQPDWQKEELRRGGFMVLEDPPIHTKHRSLANKAFTGRNINALVPLMKETAEYLLIKIKDSKEIDFLEGFAYPYIGKIIGRITGTEGGQNLSEIRRWVELLEAIPPIRPDDQFIKKLESAVTRQNSYFKEIIEDRRENPRQDLISELVHAEINGEKLTDDLLRQSLDLIISASFQTTIQMLCFSMIRLSRQPQLMSVLKASPETIPAFIEELLRHTSTAHGLLRRTKASVTLSDITIPKDALTLIMLASANRDPSHFPSPNEFVITRDNSKDHVSLGYGIHTCIGGALARLEIKSALETILSSFSSISCPPDDQLVWIDSFMTHGVCGLPIDFQ